LWNENLTLALFLLKVGLGGKKWGVVGLLGDNSYAPSLPMSSEQNSQPIFSGEICHALDGKNRVTIPSRWRKGEADEFFLMPDRTGAFVRAMPPEQFSAAAERAAANPAVTAKDHAVFLRHFYSRSQHVVVDKQGRLLVPEEYCQKANLKGEIVLVGARDTFELWSKESWEATKQNEQATFDRIAELAGL